MATLTAANSVIMIGFIDLFPAPQQIQGFEVDDIFSTESVTSVETKMGVDGFLSAGWVPTEKKMSFIIQADSASADMFDAVQQAQEAVREAYEAFGVIELPSLGKSYAMVRGFLTGYVPIPSAKKLMQARTFVMTWGSIFPAPI